MRNISPPQDLTQKDLFDSETLDTCSWWATELSKEALQHLQKNWQSLFRSSLLKLMPAENIGQHFDATQGRPTKELYSMAALVFIMEFNNWTIDQAAENYTFNTSIHYALNMGNRRNYLSPRTLDTYRKHIREDELASKVFAEVTDTLIKELNINIKRQRLDSTHILSDMANFGRTKLLGVGIKRLLAAIKRHAPADYATIPTDLIERYTESVGQLFGKNGPNKEKRANTQHQCAQDMHWLIEHFADQPSISQRNTYQALIRLFTEHCEIKEQRITVREKAQDAQGGTARTLQNPSDLEAGYSGHKGAGYQVQLAQTSATNNPVQLITACLPQSAAESDSKALVPILEQLQERGHTPEELAADTAYGSDENYQHALTQCIDLISPTPGAATKKVKAEKSTAPSTPSTGPNPESKSDDKTDDKTDDKNEIGIKPTKKRRGRPQSPEGQSKKEASEDKAQRQLQRRAREQTEEWRSKYRRRAGIESLNRALDRKTGIKTLRVRGSKAVTHSIYGKVLGWNIVQAARAIAKSIIAARKGPPLVSYWTINSQKRVITDLEATRNALHKMFPPNYHQLAA